MPTYLLSVPPSANNLFLNAGGRRIKSPKYRAWIAGALNALIAQRAKPIGSRAAVMVILPRGTRGDPENRLKGCLDILVRAEVLEDDDGKYVGRVSVGYGDVKEMHVSVEPMPETA